MRIAINTRFLLPGPLEGLGWYTHEIARRMVEQHPEDEFLFLFDRAYDPRFVFAKNVQPVVIGPPARHPLLWHLWFEWSLPRALEKWKPDVFFSPDGHLSLKAETPTAMTVHDLIPLETPEKIPALPRFFYRHFWPKFFRRAERLIVISDFTRQRLMALSDTDPKKVTVVPNGCRPGFQPLLPEEQQAVRDTVSGGQPYFFYAGAIHPRKNIHRLIRAFDAFKEKIASPVQLLLAGRMAWKTGEVKAALESARHRADIVFLGYVGETELPRLLASSLALTYVSESEGFGLPILEAFHAEVPVLTSNVTALPEVAGDAALLVDPFSEEEIAAALESLWGNEALRAELLAKGRVQRERFSWARAAEQVYEVLKQIGEVARRD